VDLPQAVDEPKLEIPTLSSRFADHDWGAEQLIKFFSDVYIFLWCYLCFCVAHAQMFDRLMRALSYFDGHADVELVVR